MQKKFFKSKTTRDSKILKFDKGTDTPKMMQDILRLDLTTEVKEFSNHVQNKIERLDERMRFVNYKFEDVRFWFKRYSISIIYLATFLTLIEALLNSFNIDNIENNDLKILLKFTPLIFSSLVSLIAAIIKFNKYEEKIEDITRATEKCIITIAKLKEVKEELYFCKTVDVFNKINDRFTRDIYTEYLESNTNIERQLLDTDYAKYMKKVAYNDVQRAKILLNRNKELDKISSNKYDKFRIMNFFNNIFNSKDSNNYSTNNDDNIVLSKLNTKEVRRKFSIISDHNTATRCIPYRGGSPPPVRSNINMKIKPINCCKCNREFLLDAKKLEQECPYCKNICKISCKEINLESIIIENNSYSNEHINKCKIIQKHWRNFINSK